MKSVIVGTAGHIDHGKTALVKALTGIDADRLEEEKRRGITIDIGFAHLELPAPDGSRLRLGFVDVPGHERFVRNMLAGVGGIDLVLLVIAADEGIKPQTREHFDICRLLAIRRGITVLTKSDAVDAETLEVVRLEVEDYLRGSFLDPAASPVVAVSSLTGAGLEQLKSALAQVASEVAVKDSAALARLPVDRVFTMKGFGTVVTGTLVGGHDSQIGRRRTRSLSCPQAGAHSRSAGAWLTGGSRRRGAAHRAESRRTLHRRSGARNDARGGGHFSFHVTNRCADFASSLGQAVQRWRPRTLPRVHIGNNRGSAAIWSETDQAGGRSICAVEIRRAHAAFARRSLHRAPVFTGRNHRRRRRARCVAAQQSTSKQRAPKT